MEKYSFHSRAGRLWRLLAVTLSVLAIPMGLAYGWPWSPDMDKQPSVRPQEAPLLPPEGSVPRSGREPRMDRVTAGEQLRNPIEPTAASLNKGKQLFEIYCALCHGRDAKGGGPVAEKFVPPPDLTLQIFRERPDGFIYGTIRDGGPLMPAQGDALVPADRWHIVNYIRSLQKKKGK